MIAQEKINIAIDFLKKKYKDAKCSLIYEKPYELLIAARLSAQCKDDRVNIVTSKLFKIYKTIDSFSNASFEEIKNIIYPCGLSNKKANDIINICTMLKEKYYYKIPNTMEELLTLSGIGRKTANLILYEIFNKPTVVVDTHFIRITNRLEIVSGKNPKKIEEEMVKLIPKGESNLFCHRMVCFGRDICRAKKPLCEICELKKICSFYIN